MESGLSTAVLHGANAPKSNVEKCGMEPSSAPAFHHAEEGAPAFEVYGQAGNPLANNEAIVRTAPAETAAPDLTPPSSRRRASR
jgi:hypothetical protein